MKFTKQKIVLLVLIIFIGLSLHSSNNICLGSAAERQVKVWWSSEQKPKNRIWFAKPLPITYSLSRQPDLTFKAKQDSPCTIAITVDPYMPYQTILGFGASFEESTVFNLSRMSPAKRSEAIKALVDPEYGIGLNLMRICFGSSDFTGQKWYSYDDLPSFKTDPNLVAFSIQKDIDYNIIPIIKEALSYNPNLKIIASPWSPPAWMKTSLNLCGGSIKYANYQTVAKYYTLAIKAYEAVDIPIYAMTVQNEPGVNNELYPSTWLSRKQVTELTKLLKKEFQNNNINTQIWIYDYIFSGAVNHINKILGDPTAYKATDGIAFHDYWGKPEAMSTIHNLYPEKSLYVTERSLWGVAGMGRLIQYLRNWSCSYNSWVTMLDSKRKPNNGPYIADPTLLIQNAKNYDDYWFTPEYYLLGQFSRFIQRGAKRIFSECNSTSPIANVAFLNPDSSVILIVTNPTDTVQPLVIDFDFKQTEAIIPQRTVATYIWNTFDAQCCGMNF